ncbi:MAG TPA: hypothetical protein VGO11_25055, partial [Chthoniobacteraceae bacterium]|nr:hypothetical protein [Chthoniobacteraceae bacterium]
MKTMRRHPLPFLFLAALAAALLLEPLAAKEPSFREPQAPAIPRHAFTITDFGAVGDGAVMNTEAF